MDIVSIFVRAAITLSIIGFVVCGWFLICNERTFRTRMDLIQARRGLPMQDFWRITAEVDLVPYSRHLWTLVFFRNPRKLYGPYTCKLMGWSREARKDG